MLINRLSLFVLGVALVALVSEPLYQRVSWRGQMPEEFRATDEVRVDAPLETRLNPGATQNYVLVTRPERLYVVDLESDRFDPVLSVQVVEDRVPRDEGTDDDGGDGNNSRLEFCSAKSGPPYILSARSFTPEGSGAFTLRVREEEGEGACRESDDPRELLPVVHREVEEIAPDGTVREGWIEVGEDTRFLLRTKPGYRYMIHLDSEDFDTYLRVHRSLRGVLTEVARDDDGGDGTNSRLIFCTSRAWYPHLVQVASYDDDGGGQYGVTVWEEGTCSN